MKYIFAILILSLISTQNIVAQKEISGQILDKQTKEPLAFVNIVFNNRHQGTISGIDGYFHIKSKNKIDTLVISFLGYKTKTLATSKIKNPNKLKIYLTPTSYNIDEVVVFPTENPAHRIINLVIKNKKINNPDNLQSYSYDSYNKMVFTFDTPNIDLSNSLDSTNQSKEDSTTAELKKFKDSQYLMMMESVSHRDFKHPDKIKEKVMASRVSGFQNPAFTLLATQIQSMSFYKNYINILDKNYLSPISSGSTRKYFFLIKDTLFDKNNDTIFVISFRPRKGKNFDGLKGVLNINSNKYAVQSVKAEPYEQDNSLVVEIMQKYEYIDNTQWFPTQLNTNLIFQNLVADSGSDDDSTDINIIGIGKSYLKNIKINPELKNKKFNHIAYEIDDDAGKKDSLFWLQYRDTLSKKELRTYEVIDSLGKEYKFDKKLNWLTNFMSGYLPINFISIDLSKLMNFNMFEGFQLGLGVETNNKLSNKIFTGGYFRYGFKDKQWKYGGHIRFDLNNIHQVSINIKYFNDVQESGGYNFLERKFRFLSDASTEKFRTILIKDMYYTEGLSISYKHRIFRYLKYKIYGKYSEDFINSPYYFSKKISNSNNAEIISENNYFISNEIGIKLKYAFKEKFAKTNNKLISLGTKYPVIYFNYAKGLDFYNGEVFYDKYEALIYKFFRIKNIGTSAITLTAGYTNNNIPYIYLYNGHGSFYNFSIETANSFGTMRMNEFLSDEFVNLFYRHDFKSLLFKTKWFQPKIGIITNAGYGYLKHPENHNNISYKTMEKGFFESGIIVNNIFKQNFSSYGIAIYYRWGPYSLAKTYDNFAFKLSMYYSL